MHILGRNKKTVWYANPTTLTPVYDDNNLNTGTYTLTYDTPTKVRMSVSVSSGANNLGSQGMAELNPFGIESAYTHRMTTDDMSCPITEESIIWYRREPTKTVTVTRTVNGETVTEETEVPVPHNFKVVRIARSDTHITYYIKEADVS